MTEPETVLLKGKFTYPVGDSLSVVEFDGHGRLTVTLDGEIIVTATYNVSGDRFEVIAEAGPYAEPEAGIGRYRWNLAGEILTFSLLEDKSRSRLKAFALPWKKAD